MKEISKELQEQIEHFKAVRQEEMVEATMWIKNGKPGAVWHWEGEEKQLASLDGSYDYFKASYPHKEDQTEESIIRFCGQEVYNLWNGYEDDNVESRANHCLALYNYIKEKLNKSVV